MKINLRRFRLPIFLGGKFQAQNAKCSEFCSSEFFAGELNMLDKTRHLRHRFDIFYILYTELLIGKGREIIL